MHIFIDESGTFVCRADGRTSVSAVGALVIPTGEMAGFERLYGRVRHKLPQLNGEIKGKNLSEDHVADVAKVLRKLGALFEVVTIDMGLHSEQELRAHKSTQEKAITAHLTDDHHPRVRDQVWELRHELEEMSLQLYVQSIAMSELVYDTLNHANCYFGFRRPAELGSYHWTIDAKDRSSLTPWEKWWSTVILPMLESHSFREPFIAAEGGDYRWHDRLKIVPSDYKRQHMKYPDSGECFDLRPVMTEDFRFSSKVEYGLEAVDILTNTVRRSMSGHFQRRGWMTLPQLMIHRRDHYIRLISLRAEDGISPKKLPYSIVVNDFRHGGRSMIPSGFHSR